MHRTPLRCSLAAAALFASAPCALAQQQTILITPPLQLGTPQNPGLNTGAQCIATNATLQTRQITLQMFDGLGVPTKPEDGPVAQAVAPLAVAVLDDGGYTQPTSAAEGVRYCLITVAGTANDVRATLCLRSDAPEGRCTVAVEATTLSVTPIQ